MTLEESVESYIPVGEIVPLVPVFQAMMMGKHYEECFQIPSSQPPKKRKLEDHNDHPIRTYLIENKIGVEFNPVLNAIFFHTTQAVESSKRDVYVPLHFAVKKRPKVRRVLSHCIGIQLVSTPLLGPPILHCVQNWAALQNLPLTEGHIGHLYTLSPDMLFRLEIAAFPQLQLGDVNISIDNISQETATPYSWDTLPELTAYRNMLKLRLNEGTISRLHNTPRKLGEELQLLFRPITDAQLVPHVEKDWTFPYSIEKLKIIMQRLLEGPFNSFNTSVNYPSISYSKIELLMEILFAMCDGELDNVMGKIEKSKNTNSFYTQRGTLLHQLDALFQTSANTYHPFAGVYFPSDISQAQLLHFFKNEFSLNPFPTAESLTETYTKISNYVLDHYNQRELDRMDSENDTESEWLDRLEEIQSNIAMLICHWASRMGSDGEREKIPFLLLRELSVGLYLGGKPLGVRIGMMLDLLGLNHNKKHMEDVKTVQNFKGEISDPRYHEVSLRSMQILRLNTLLTLQSDTFEKWLGDILKTPKGIPLGDTDHIMSAPLRIFPDLNQVDLDGRLKTDLRIMELTSEEIYRPKISLTEDEKIWLHAFIIEILIPFVHVLNSLNMKSEDWLLRFYELAKNVNRTRL